MCTGALVHDEQAVKGDEWAGPAARLCLSATAKCRLATLPRRTACVRIAIWFCRYAPRHLLPRQIVCMVRAALCLRSNPRAAWPRQSVCTRRAARWRCSPRCASFILHAAFI